MITANVDSWRVRLTSRLALIDDGSRLCCILFDVVYIPELAFNPWRFENSTLALDFDSDFAWLRRILLITRRETMTQSDGQ